MADLTFMYETSTLGIVDKAIETAGAKKKPRRYLGMSSIGDECSRRLWLQYHTDFTPSFSGRVLRLFETGHLIERRIVRDLKKAGFKVSGRQLKFKDFGGKFRGHCDGIVEGLYESSKPHILEIKSASDKWYKDFLKNGMLTNEKYSAQINLYMHYAGLDRGIFILENKDNSERYQERVKLDRGLVEQLRSKAAAIIRSKRPPGGISDRPDFWLCRLCPMNTNEWCRKSWKPEDPF